MDEIHIYLVRHGQTEANVNAELYKTKADHAILLTEKGHKQAVKVGAELTAFLCDLKEKTGDAFGKIRVWHSPYYRARQTAGHIINQLGKKFGRHDGSVTHREELFLIEQKAGLFDGIKDEEYMAAHPEEARDYQKHVAYCGRTYAGVPLGDSRLDVAMRVKPFFGTVLRDYQTSGVRHVVVVCHGVTLRAFNMAWMRYAPEWLDSEQNPGNCWVRHIHGNSKVGYADEGYIFGEGAPLRDRLATQQQLQGAENIFMLAPQRPNGMVPKGVKAIDPFDYEG